MGLTEKNVCTVKNLCNLFKKNFSYKINLKKNNSNKNFYESKLLYLSNQKAKNELNWTPLLNLKSTVKLTSDWYKKNLDSNLKLLRMETCKQVEIFNNFYDF